MATEYSISANGKVVAAPFDPATISDKVVWLDVDNPSRETLSQLKSVLDLEELDWNALTEIELSSRMYRTGSFLVMVANLMPKHGHQVMAPKPVAFIFGHRALVTIRYNEFFSFERVAHEIGKIDDPQSPLSIFCWLTEEAVGDRADSLEYAMRHMEDLASRLFAHPGNVKAGQKEEKVLLETTLKEIGAMGERIANVRESISSLQRILNFAKAHVHENLLGEHKPMIESMINDLTALSDEASFLMNKLSFNLDATLGMINIEETKIIRVLSVVTLVLSPPMLIAGIYGMNFPLIPELQWPLGYYISLGLMAATALLPIGYLRYKRWI